jgi:hypothetical protein
MEGASAPASNAGQVKLPSESLALRATQEAVGDGEMQVSEADLL